MSVITVASGKSVYRGYEYFRSCRVRSLNRTAETLLRAEVSGSNGAVYQTMVDVVHPLKSKCDCPHAAGRRIVCKHMVAVYFTAFPEEAANYIRQLEAYEEEAELQQVELEDAVVRYVDGLKKSELQETLLQVLFDGPQWQFDRFAREHLDY